MDKIKYISDRRGRKRYPITHEKAVRDSEFVTLDRKLKELMGVVSDIMPLVVPGSVSSSEFTPTADSPVPAFADIVEAFKRWAVILTYEDGGKECADMVVYADSGLLKTANGISWSEDEEEVEIAVPEDPPTEP